MTAISLLNPTGTSQIDQALLAVVGIFSRQFPELIRAFYLEGSYANGSEVIASDVDLVVIFNDPAQKELAKEIAEYCVSLSSIELDINIMTEAELLDGISPVLKLGGRLIYGQDVIADLPMLSIEQWTRDRMHASYWLMTKLFNRPEPVTFPLGYPDQADEFFGYAQRKLRLTNGLEVNCTRDLIRVTGWAATALIALKARQYVGRKRDCHKAYSECFNDEWSALLEIIYIKCRGEWNYLIPDGVEERESLRRVCVGVLGFENHFLAHYKDFLLAELNHVDESVRNFATWVMGMLLYQDPDIIEVLGKVKADGNEKRQ
jgi:hypothetical protein